MVIADELTGSVELCLVCCYVVVALLGVCAAGLEVCATLPPR